MNISATSSPVAEHERQKIVDRPKNADKKRTKNYNYFPPQTSKFTRP